MNSVVLDALFWGAVVACALAQVFIIRAVLRTAPTPAPDAPDVPQPRRVLEIAWAVLPAFLLAAAFIGAWRAVHPPAP
jgi:heme/copper-type cytochrome/quinol oxidase subunit 2